MAAFAAATMDSARGLGYRAEIAGGGLDCLLGLLFQLSGSVDKPGTLRLRAELLGVECEDDVTEGADRGDRGLDLGAISSPD